MRARVSMGTELRVSLWTTEEAAASTAADAVFAEFDRLEALMSVWRDGSDIQRLNAAAGDPRCPCQPDVLAVFRSARQISEWTDGSSTSRSARCRISGGSTTTRTIACPT